MGVGEMVSKEQMNKERKCERKREQLRDTEREADKHKETEKRTDSEKDIYVCREKERERKKEKKIERERLSCRYKLPHTHISPGMSSSAWYHSWALAGRVGGWVTGDYSNAAVVDSLRVAVLRAISSLTE